MAIGINEPGVSECVESWCTYTFWGGCAHTYGERILNGPWDLYVLLFMVLLPVLGLVGLLGNGLLVGFLFRGREQPNRTAITTTYQIIGMGNMVMGLVALLHTITLFTLSLPCNSQPVEEKVSETWIQLQVIVNLLFLIMVRFMPLFVLLLGVFRALEVWERVGPINFRVPILLAIIWLGLVSAFLIYKIGLNARGSNIMAPLFAVTVRDSPDWSFYYFVFADWMPVVVISTLVLGTMALVGTSAGRRKNGWVDREYRLDMGIASLSFLHVLSVTCQAVGFCYIINDFVGDKITINMAYIPVYCLSVVSVFVFAAATPMLSLRWNRRFKLWLSIGSQDQHIYDTLALSEYSTAKTDASTTFSLARTIRTRLGLSAHSSDYDNLTELTDMSTLFQPGSTVVVEDGDRDVPSTRSFRTDCSSEIRIVTSSSPGVSLVGGENNPVWSDVTSVDNLTDLYLGSQAPTSSILTRTDASSALISLPEDDRSSFSSKVEYEQVIASRKDELKRMRREQEDLMAEYRRNLEIISGYSTGEEMSTVYFQEEEESGHMTRSRDSSDSSTEAEVLSHRTEDWRTGSVTDVSSVWASSLGVTEHLNSARSPSLSLTSDLSTNPSTRKSRSIGNESESERDDSTVFSSVRSKHPRRR